MSHGALAIQSGIVYTTTIIVMNTNEEAFLMRDIDALVQHVHDGGGKVTTQRLLIWQALYQNTTHPTAEDLYAQLRPSLPSLSLTTLYNALNELVEWGEVRRFDIGDGHIHFDPNIVSHAELVCLRCHSVIDAPEISVKPQMPAEIAGYQIISRAEQYYGFCPRCRGEAGISA